MAKFPSDAICTCNHRVNMNTLLYDVCASTDPTWPLYKYNHFNVDAANVQRIGTDLKFMGFEYAIPYTDGGVS
jgi:hypothetical protein